MIMSTRVLIQVAVAIFLLVVAIYISTQLLVDKSTKVIYRSIAFILVCITSSFWAFSVVAVNYFGQNNNYDLTIFSIKMAFASLLFSSLGHHFLAKFFVTRIENNKESFEKKFESTFGL